MRPKFTTFYLYGKYLLLGNLSKSFLILFFGANGKKLRRNGKARYPLMEGISKMPYISSRTVPYWKAFPKCLASPHLNRKGSQRNLPTITIGAILKGLNDKNTRNAKRPQKSFLATCLQNAPSPPKFT